MGSYNTELENQLWALLSKLENGAPGCDMDGRAGCRPNPNLRWGFAMLAELRTLDLWRAVIGECLAVVFYVLLVCGAYSPWAGQPTPPERHLVISLVAGFAMTVLVHCFCQVSGGHVNPAVTIALAAMRRVSPLRALLLVLAQLGGGIAGAALLFGATSSGYSGDLGATVISRVITVGQGFGVEFLLSFVVVLAYFSAMCPHRRPSGGHPALIVGLAYLATTLVGLPLTGASMNPARSLGPAFVMNTWHAHWVYWAGPILGGLTAGFIHEFIFNPRRSPLSRNHSTDGGEGGDCSDGVGVDEEEGALRQAPVTSSSQSGGSAHAQYNPLRRHAARSHAHPRHNSASSPPPGDEIYSAESVYGYDDYIYSGSKSLYTPASRPTNLHRSQSVYTRPLPVPNAAPTPANPPAGPVQDQKQTVTGLLHNNLMVYNAQQQQKQRHQQQYQQQIMQQQQHLPNNINKPSSVSGSVSHFSKNIRNVPPSESEYSVQSARRTPLKSNLIKPEPIYKTGINANSATANHNNQNQLHHQTQHHMQHQPPQSYQVDPNLQQPHQTYQNTTTHSSQSSNNGTERCSSVLSGIGVANPHAGGKFNSGAEEDDASQYGNTANYPRNFGRNRPELPTPGGSVHSDMAVAPNTMLSYAHYPGTHGDKLY